MDNQQPSTLEERIRFLTRNAIFGDGTLWKHPECINYKLVFTSTSPELLEVKRSIAPEIFTVGVKQNNSKNQSGRFPNAKPMYRLASVVNHVITEYKKRPKEEVIQELTLADFALWYLDDGSVVKRTDSKTSYRFILCIGDACETEKLQELFILKLQELFGAKFGRITKNNSKATEKK